MSLFAMDGVVDPNIISPLNFENEGARNCLMGMGFTADNVARKYNINREEMDLMAYESHQKAAKAQKAGLFAKEITPYKTTVKDAEGNEKEVVVDRDDGIREETTLEGLKKLKPAFGKDGITTAGTSS
jgi:acetyl-CoA acyltransferase 1